MTHITHIKYMHPFKFFLVTATVFFISMFELHVQALTPIPKIISDGEVSIISKSGGSIVGKAASSTNVS